MSERSDGGSDDPLLPSALQHPSPAQGWGGRQYSAPGCVCTWTNFSRGSFADGASTGVRSTINLGFARGDKGVDQKTARASGAGSMSPPCAFRSSYEDNGI
jgi:hypothetical protein